MYRFRPSIDMRAYPLEDYPARCRQAAAIMHMIMNNLDPRVAQVWVGMATNNNDVMMTSSSFPPSSPMSL